MGRKPKDSWSREIAEQFCDNIPILSKIPKGVEQHHFSFNGFAKDMRLAQAITYHTNRFGSPAELLRAALHIGVFIIYHLSKENEGTLHERAERLMVTFKEMEPIYYKQEVMDEILLNVKYTRDCCRSGLISTTEFAEKISEVLESSKVTFDESFCELLKAKIEDLADGKNVTELTTCKSHGGVRDIKSK
jgi:hypothetical protein